VSRHYVKLTEVEDTLAEVEMLTADREDPFWCGFSQAVEEIAERLGVPFTPCVSPARSTGEGPLPRHPAGRRSPL